VQLGGGGATSVPDADGAPSFMRVRGSRVECGAGEHDVDGCGRTRVFVCGMVREGEDKKGKRVAHSFSSSVANEGINPMSLMATVSPLVVSVADLHARRVG
jgi:hypothetical protein